MLWAKIYHKKKLYLYEQQALSTNFERGQTHLIHIKTRAEQIVGSKSWLRGKLFSTIFFGIYLFFF